MKLLGFCSRGIEYLFYALLLLVPLIFAGNTSELFEFNKMWLTFGISTLIGVLWFSKMAIQKKWIFKRTILDIPIFLFLASQIISTVLSIDQHVSFWGYYSRFNGGLLSTITYIFLYYAFVSNFPSSDALTDKKLSFWQRRPSIKTLVRNSLVVSVISGFLVALWALPSHFGYDPTCLVFRGHLDVACWTADFQPKIRIFGPLGQPDWLAGYMGVLLPITLAFILNGLRSAKNKISLSLVFYSVSFGMFYLSLLYTGSRSGIAAGILSLLIMAGGYFFINRKNLSLLKNRFAAGFLAVLLLISFFAGIPLPILSKVSFSELQAKLHKTSPTVNVQTVTPAAPAAPSGIELGGSNSFQIRKIVWKGAVDVWRANPLFGSGVETFAYSYYLHRPIEHNLVSEWNFLYNKAHNEYLNYLATTGIFGLGTYLSFVGLFLAVALLNLSKIKPKSPKFLASLKSDTPWDKEDSLLLGLFASFISILMINFFGFSVVILNIYLLLIPAFVLVLLGLLKQGNSNEKVKSEYVSYVQWALVASFFVTGLFILYFLLNSWRADVKYALGSNYNSAREYQTAYPLLHEAVKMRSEPVFLDQMSVNDAILAAGFASQQSSQSANLVQSLAKEAMDTSQKLTTDYPNNVVFWKSRVRILYALASLDPRFMPLALDAIKKTAELAPTDASVLYNLGVLYGQNNDSKKAVEVLERTVLYKPDYREAHFALGIFYHELSVNSKGAVINTDYHNKAIQQLKYILENLLANDPQTAETLNAWTKER